MLYNDENNSYDPDYLQLVRGEIFAFNAEDVPTHTEDGIPIRKLYVSNLPPKTTRTELFGVFAPYGFIKSCWLRMGDKGPDRIPMPTYAFVTYSNPADAHKALQAPHHEKTLRGRHLRIKPADSWHQPAEDTDGHVRWKPRTKKYDSTADNDDEQIGEEAVLENTPGSSEQSNIEVKENNPSNCPEEPTIVEPEEYSILDILNHDCLTHIMTYVPIRDLVRSERVSKQWKNMVQDYLEGMRTFKTSWWQHDTVTLTTCVLRRVLSRVGARLSRLHIDHRWSALNDRTAHTVGKFCPNLEELKVYGMHTKNWNPLTYGCKNLKHLSFISCNKLSDSSLVHLMKTDSTIESLTVANNTHVTGLFLTGSSPANLTSLAFFNCCSLQGTVLSAAIDSLTNLTTLKLDVCPISMWKIVPLIISQLQKLEELSLSEYSSIDKCLPDEIFIEALGNLKDLKKLNLSRNVHINDAVLKQVGQTCSKLEVLIVAGCNYKNTIPQLGVGDEGIAHISNGCRLLEEVDISYLARLTDTGVGSLKQLTQLRSLICRGNPVLSAQSLIAVFSSCHQLEELDLCGCDNITEEVVTSCESALVLNPRRVVLRLASTLVSSQDLPTNKLMAVDIQDDSCDPHLRPDFVDCIFDGSDDSIAELDEMDPDIFYPSDEDLFMQGEIEDYLPVYAFQFPIPNVFML